MKALKKLIVLAIIFIGFSGAFTPEAEARLEGSSFEVGALTDGDFLQVKVNYTLPLDILKLQLGLDNYSSLSDVKGVAQRDEVNFDGLSAQADLCIDWLCVEIRGISTSSVDRKTGELDEQNTALFGGMFDYSTGGWRVKVNFLWNTDKNSAEEEAIENPVLNPILAMQQFSVSRKVGKSLTTFTEVTVLDGATQNDVKVFAGFSVTF